MGNDSPKLHPLEFPALQAMWLPGAFPSPSAIVTVYITLGRELMICVVQELLGSRRDQLPASLSPSPALGGAP